MNLPLRSAAPKPGWTVDADVVIVGSGIAGLTIALHLARGSALRVLLVTKDVLAAGSTRWAQGGIAAALGAGDSPDQHAAVRELAQIGARFDRAADGSLALTREGGHHRNRIAHAGGDATGAEIERALVTRVLDATNVEVIEHALALDLLLDDAGRAAGLTLHVMGEGQHDGVGAVRARAVVLATGGIGQIYASTTNPAVSTADGVAVVPACHYASGGVRTDLFGETSVPNLFACGETACTGVHGANRLASNSLLEGPVFGRRIAEVLCERLAEPESPASAAARVRAARLREETRGSHWREDFPERDDAMWRGHLDATLGEDGYETRFAR